jgi:hypothetical protein
MLRLCCKIVIFCFPGTYTHQNEPGTVEKSGWSTKWSVQRIVQRTGAQRHPCRIRTMFQSGSTSARGMAIANAHWCRMCGGGADICLGLLTAKDWVTLLFDMGRTPEQRNMLPTGAGRMRGLAILPFQMGALFDLQNKSAQCDT